MKKIIVIIAISTFLTSCGSLGKLAKAGVNTEEGSDFFYKVEASGNTYDFNININHFSKDDGVSFDWEMGEVNSGSISIDKQAMETSMALHNYFSSGYIHLKNKTAVWVSEKMFNDLKAQKPVEIDLGKSKETFTLSESKTYTFGNKDNGETYEIPIIIASTKDGKKEIWIADDVTNRLIVKMKLDFDIWLTNYKPYN